MSWNYRVMRDRKGYLTIRQCHYDRRSTVPHSWSALPAQPGGETLEDIKLELLSMMEAVEKPILDEVELDAKKGNRK